nr:LysR family transcriptional regulator [uncultured Holophaga sp.]
MHFNQLDLNLLVALDVLLDEHNITRAGHRINLSQSAMSGCLARLREFFNDELLVQVGRKMVPTPLGESLAQPVRDCLVHIQSAIATKPTFDPATSQRHFKIMLSDYMSIVFMPEVMRRMAEVAPQITVEIVSSADYPLEALEKGEIDFRILPESFQASSHCSEFLLEDPYTCMVWTGNPEVRGELSPEQFLDMRHVLLRFGRERAPSRDEIYLSRLGYHRRVDMIATWFGVLPHFIVGTSRITTLPLRLGKVFAEQYPVRLLAPPIAIEPMVQTICWHKYYDYDPGKLWMRRLMKEVAEGLGPASPRAM